jgi:hypothetical protein
MRAQERGHTIRAAVPFSPDFSGTFAFGGNQFCRIG